MRPITLTVLVKAEVPDEINLSDIFIQLDHVQFLDTRGPLDAWSLEGWMTTSVEDAK